MADFLYDKITYEELVASGTKIEKKIILVNSSKYTDEAFDYLLDLANNNESIVFITDKRQIYTHGEYYGGDIWEESLNYFQKFTLSNSSGQVTGSVSAMSSNDVLQIQGEGGIDLTADYDVLNDTNILHINYNLTTAVDHTHLVDIGNGINLSLAVDESNKISIKKYEGINIWFGELSVIEYDSPDAVIGVKVHIKDITKLNTISFTATNGVIPTFDYDTLTVSCVVPKNQNITIYADYIYDGISGTISVDQKWGYGWYAGIMEVNGNTFSALNKKYESEFVDKTVTIKQPVGEYGWFACPKRYNLLFTDIDTGLAGGWQKMSTFTKYSNSIEYQVYRTVNAGLGTVNWKITQKQF